MAIYTHPSELDYNELLPGDQVVIGSITATVTATFINLGSGSADSRGKHQEACRLFDVHHIARLIYSDQSDMSGDFPQYKNMRDATKIAQELMRRNYIPQPLRRDLPMFATEAGPVYGDRASCGAPMSATEAAIRAMKDWTSVSYSEKMMTEPVTEKKKSRIVFSKIR